MWHIQNIGKRKNLLQSNVKRIANVGPITSLLLLIGIHIRTHLLINKSKTKNQSKNQSESLEPGQSKIQDFWLLLIIFWLLLITFSYFNHFRTKWRFHLIWKGNESWTLNFEILHHHHHQKKNMQFKENYVITNGKFGNFGANLKFNISCLYMLLKWNDMKWTNYCLIQKLSWIIAGWKNSFYWKCEYVK